MVYTKWFKLLLSFLFYRKITQKITRSEANAHCIYLVQLYCYPAKDRKTALMHLKAADKISEMHTINLCQLLASYKSQILNSG